VPGTKAAAFRAGVIIETSVVMELEVVA